jgi:group I intron endonuclease
MINITSSIPIIGIYKIISPSGKVYIGQSINIKKRWNNYKWLHNSAVGPYLLRSLKKHKPENHIFEIIENCSIEQLNGRETYYKQIELNRVNGDWSKVLFCELHDRGSGPRSKHIIEKIRQGNTGKKRSIECKRKISQFQKGRPKPEGYKEKLKQALTGKTRSEDTKKRMSECRKGIPNLKNKKPKPPGFSAHLTGRLPKAVHQISPMDNSIIATYPSLKIASESTGICDGNISRCCQGKGKTAGKYKWLFA